MTPFYAHSKPDSPKDTSHWEPLFTEECNTLEGGNCPHCENLDSDHGHLNKVAYLAGKFAAEMFAPESTSAKTAKQWGELAGWWHDLGKFAPEWQEYLKNKVDPHRDDISGKVDHSTTGAQFSLSTRAPCIPLVSRLTTRLNSVTTCWFMLRRLPFARSFRAACNASGTPRIVIVFISSTYPSAIKLQAF